MPPKAMNNPSSTIDNIYLIYSGRGHLRFSLPPELCGKGAASGLERGLARLEGVYRVHVFKVERKLSIRFDDAVTNLKAIALRLRDTIQNLGENPEKGIEEGPSPPSAAPQKQTMRPPELLPSLWKKFKAKRPLMDMEKRMSGRLVVDSKTEREIISVLNEVVVFYLVKLHWDVITNRLIKKPLSYTGAWLSLFYMVFLYVRHKKGHTGA